jgi:hypothetical protein
MGNTASEPITELVKIVEDTDQPLPTNTCEQLNRACMNFTFNTGRCHDCGFRIDEHSIYCPELQPERLEQNLSIWSKRSTGTCSECSDRSIYESASGMMLCEKHAQDVIAGRVEYFPRRTVLHRRVQESEDRWRLHQSELAAQSINRTFGQNFVEPDQKADEPPASQEKAANGALDVYSPAGKLIGSMTITPTTTIAQFKEAIMRMEALQRSQRDPEVSAVELVE